jgi:hypothetical protein
MTSTLWAHQARPRTSWYGLDPVEQKVLLDRWDALNEEAVAAGAERVGTYAIRGQSDFSTLDVWIFPSPDDVFRFWEARVLADYVVWFAFSNQVGTALPAPGGHAILGG